MFDDAEKKIARLMRESTTSGESKSGLGKIKVKGRGNIVAMGDINLSIFISAGHDKMSDKTVAVATEAKEVMTHTARSEAIIQKCREIGDANLFRPFIKAAYGAEKLEDMAASDLERLEWWLGIRDTRP